MKYFIVVFMFGTQGQGPYTARIKKVEADIVSEMKRVQELIGK